jgi:hypothetical protein
MLTGLDINVCLIPVKTDVGQVDLVLRLSDGTSEKVRFSNVPVRRTNLYPHLLTVDFAFLLVKGETQVAFYF